MTSASRQHAELVDHLFGSFHSPAWAPQFGGWNPTLPAFHPTRKSPKRHVFARLPLMRFGLMHFDVDPEVEAVCTYPFEIMYWSADSDGVALRRPHIPDVAILMRDGRVIFIDYVPIMVQASRTWQSARNQQLQDHFVDVYESAYVVHDERRVCGEPLFSNVQLLWRYLPCKADPPLLSVVREAVLQKAAGRTIRSIAQAISRDVPKLGNDLSSYVFTAVMQLIAEGRLAVDLSLPITSESIVNLYGGGK